MTSFVINESHLRRLTPATRRELLRVIGDDFDDLKEALEVREWDPEGNTSYPLTPDEAAVLLRGMPEHGLKTLRVFANNFDGERGRGELKELLEATGFSDYHELSEEFAWILSRLRSVTGNHDAWLFNWRAQDWVWEAETKTYSKGIYYISRHAAQALRDAFKDI